MVSLDGAENARPAGAALTHPGGEGWDAIALKTAPPPLGALKHSSLSCPLDILDLDTEPKVSGSYNKGLEEGQGCRRDSA